MTTLPKTSRPIATRPRARFCAGCQVGQGRQCACRKHTTRSWCISQPEFWRLYLTLVVGIVGALVWWVCA